ncbi:MAG TPA: acyl carrier protein [Bauldia sp.]|nr:acyl carrier protein [Bauldia sp.]
MGVEQKIGRWVVIYLAVLSGRNSDSIDLDARFAEFDIDSVDAVEMATEFEKAFGVGIGPEFFLRGDQSVRDMVEELAERVAA